MLGWFAAWISDSASFDRLTGQTMLDWPDATHTSPTITSSSRTVFVPRIVAEKGPPARPGSK